MFIINVHVFCDVEDYSFWHGIQIILKYCFGPNSFGGPIGCQMPKFKVLNQAWIWSKEVEDLWLKGELNQTDGSVLMDFLVPFLLKWLKKTEKSHSE